MSDAVKHDGQLLEQFALSGAEEPFAELVRRHESLVFGACYRVLGQTHDAEDAAQAVFLTLAHRANALRGYRSVAGWLHTVAWNISLRARDASRARRNRELEAGNMAMTSREEAPGRPGNEEWAQVGPLLDAELASLPEKYRIPLILHHVQGHTQQQIAQLLGCTAGALSRRMSRAEELLRGRLLRRGIVFSPAVLFLLISTHAPASAPAHLMASVVHAAPLIWAGHAATPHHFTARARALSEGALRTMYIAKLKIAAGVFVAAGILGAAAIAMYPASAAEGPAVPVAAPLVARTAVPVSPAKRDLKDSNPVAPVLHAAPAAPVDPEIATWIQQLAHQDAEVRLAAMEHLRKSGEKARTALEAAAANGPDDIKNRAAVLCGVLKTAPLVQTIAAQSQQLKSYQADLDFNWIMGGVPVALKGRVKALPEKRFFVTDLAMTWGMNITSHSVCDGKAVWAESTVPGPGMATRKPVLKTLLDDADADANPANFMSYAGKIDFTATKDDVLGNVAVRVLDGVLRDDYRSKQPKVLGPIGAIMSDQYTSAARCTLWVGKDDGLPRKLEMKDEQNNTIVTNTFTGIVFGIKLDDAQFVYCPPPNTVVTDLDAVEPAEKPADSGAASKGKDF